MAKETNIENLKKALSEIQRLIDNGKHMTLTSICKKYHLGASTERKLKFALLEFEYSIPKSETPLRKMRIKRDNKTWEFIFRHKDGSPKLYVLVNDLDDILYAMQQCPKDKANPWYYNKDKSQAVEQSAPEEIKAAIDLSGISTEELAAELFSRGWIITYGVL